MRDMRIYAIAVSLFVLVGAFTVGCGRSMNAGNQASFAPRTVVSPVPWYLTESDEPSNVSQVRAPDAAAPSQQSGNGPLDIDIQMAADRMSAAEHVTDPAARSVQEAAATEDAIAACQDIRAKHRQVAAADGALCAGLGVPLAQ